jgi:hypothetical protein
MDRIGLLTEIRIGLTKEGGHADSGCELGFWRCLAGSRGTLREACRLRRRTHLGLRAAARACAGRNRSCSRASGSPSSDGRGRGSGERLVRSPSPARIQPARAS